MRFNEFEKRISLSKRIVTIEAGFERLEKEYVT